MNLRTVFSRIIRYARLLNPEPKVGGLEITGTAVRFLMIEGAGEAFTVSVRLPPGTVARGRIVEPDQLARALRDIRSRVSTSKRPVPVVLVLPAEAVYVQAFTLPALAADRLAEATALNLEILSPLPIREMYASSQRIGAGANAANQVELLAAFAERAVADVYGGVLEAAGFTAVAVEFPALALNRLAAAEGTLLDPGTPYLVIHVTNDGVGMTILRDLALAFHHFTPWAVVREAASGRAVTVRDLAEFLERDIQRFLNFYTSRWGGAIGNVILVSQELSDVLTRAILDRFPLRVSPLALGKFPELPPLWFPVLGAAERGAIARSRDAFITLASESAPAQYGRERAYAFAGLWRTVLVTLAAFFLVASVLVDSFIAREETRLRARLAAEPSPPEAGRLTALEAEARSWNELAAQALRAHELSPEVSPLFELIGSLVSGGASLRRVTLQDGWVTVAGAAPSPEAGAALRSRFLREEEFAEIAFPLGNIRENADGTASWSARFRWVIPGGSPPPRSPAQPLPLPR